MCVLHLNLNGHVVELCMQDDHISDTEKYHVPENSCDNFINVITVS